MKKKSCLSFKIGKFKLFENTFKIGKVGRVKCSKPVRRVKKIK